MTRVYFVDLERIYGERYKQILFEFQKSHPADVFLSYCARNVVKNIASDVLNIDPNDIIFLRQKYVKPYIKGYPDFNFNISHTENAIAIAISDYPVGVDVERIGETNYKIAERFFAQGEKQYLYSINESTKQRFFEIWTKKEAYLKWTGEGLTRPLISFDVTDSTFKSQVHSIINNGFVISICTSSFETLRDFDFIELDVSNLELDSKIML